MKLSDKAFQSAFNQAGRPGLLVKALIAIGLCLIVRLLAAQAPAAAPDGSASEEMDAQSYKIQVPISALTKGPTARSQETKYRSNVRQILAGNVNLNADATTRRD